MRIKEKQNVYLTSISTFDFSPNFMIRFKKLAKKIQRLLRKVYGSTNSIKDLASITTLIFGLVEDIKHKGFPNYSFDEELKIVNDYLLWYLKNKWATRYDHECSSYGEAALALYLDLFITATTGDVNKELQAKPTFLKNPKTGAVLEIDIWFEDFHLAFEFQGEKHYIDNKVKEKDNFKLEELRKKKIVLIPVNISQLNYTELQRLIVNSIKDFLGIHNLFTDERSGFMIESLPSTHLLLNFSKIAQRLYLSKLLFVESLKWLDDESEKYITNVAKKNPISSNYPAPRQTPEHGDFDIEYIYKKLKYVTQVRKSRTRRRVSKAIPKDNAKV